MTFGDYAEARLTRANARAKVIELSADSYNTPVRELDADKLHYSCIATISRYLDAKTQGSDTEPHIADLKKVAEFYDAASTYEEYATNNDGYWIFAASAYFLTKNYGSAIVSLKKSNSLTTLEVTQPFSITIYNTYCYKIKPQKLYLNTAPFLKTPSKTSFSRELSML